MIAPLARIVALEGARSSFVPDQEVSLILDDYILDRKGWRGSHGGPNCLAKAADASGLRVGIQLYFSIQTNDVACRPEKAEQPN
jgi:hypothetical protein